MLNRVTSQGQLGGVGVDHDLVSNVTPYAVMQSRIFGLSGGRSRSTATISSRAIQMSKGKPSMKLNVKRISIYVPECVYVQAYCHI